MAYEYKIDKSRQFEMILYPQEDMNHRELLDFIHNNFEYIACTHDKDFVIDEKTGERVDKKPHTHVIVVFANQRKASAVYDMFRVHCMAVASYRVRVRYLIHADDPDKAQYSPSCVFGNRAEDIFEHIKGDKSTVFKSILKYIQDTSPTYMMVVSWCLEEGFFDVFQKNAYIISGLIRERSHKCIACDSSDGGDK